MQGLRARAAITVPAPPRIDFHGGGADPVTALVSGEIDFAAAEPMRRRIAEALGALRSRELIVDLSGVEFMDSSGLRALLQLRGQLRGEGGRMVIAAPTETVRGVLELTGVQRCLQVAQTPRQARTLLGQAGG